MFMLPLVQAAHRHSFLPLAALRRAEAAASLAQAINRHQGDQATPELRSPAMNVDETPSHYLLSFELPGVAKESLQVSVQGRRVQVETRSVPDKAAGGAMSESSPDLSPTDRAAAATAESIDTPVEVTTRNLYRERSGLRFARTVSLPQEVDSDACEARFENGVLSLQLAKRTAGARHLVIS